MTASELLRRRLARHGLTTARFTSAAELVTAFGAVQAQDFAGAKWAIGLRTGENDSAVEHAFNSGAILRTHVLRPTWHFVAPADLRWMLRLTAPRVKAFSASMERKLGISDAVVARANDLIARVVGERGPVERGVLADTLRRARVDVSENRFVHLLMRAELDAVICSGPRVGRQHTYAAFDSRVPRGGDWPRDRALAELARRYFTSRGPATLTDFAWWSGLTIADGRQAVEMLAGELERREIDGRLHWFAPGPAPRAPRGAVYLLPNYDEYGIAYRERAALLGAPVRLPGAAGLRHFFIVDGVVRGTWDADVGTRAVAVRFPADAALPEATGKRLQRAAKDYANFLGLPLAREAAPAAKARRPRR